MFIDAIKRNLSIHIISKIEILQYDFFSDHNISLFKSMVKVFIKELPPFLIGGLRWRSDLPPEPFLDY